MEYWGFPLLRHIQGMGLETTELRGWKNLSFGPFHNFKGVYRVVHFFLASFWHWVIWLKTSLGKDPPNAGPPRVYLLLYQGRVVSPPEKRVVYWRYFPLSILLHFTWYVSSCKYVTNAVMKHVCRISLNFYTLKQFSSNENNLCMYVQVCIYVILMSIHIYFHIYTCM